MKEKRPISLIILIFLLALFFSYHLYYYVQKRINKQHTDNFFIQEEILDNNFLEKNYPQQLVDKEEYLGILSIPKIKLEKGFYPVNSKNNNVNKNIELIKTSDMPNISGGTVIIAAHRGHSYVGFFNDLERISLSDKIFIYYDKMKYTYIVNNIYEDNKTGNIKIEKNIHENYLVLTTCSKKKNKQLIVTSKLLYKEKML